MIRALSLSITLPKALKELLLDSTHTLVITVISGGREAGRRDWGGERERGREVGRRERGGEERERGREMERGGGKLFY